MKLQKSNLGETLSENAGNQNLVTYDMVLPRKVIVQTLNYVGITLMLVAPAVSFWFLLWWASSPWYHYSYETGFTFTPWLWIIPVAMFILGLVLYFGPGELFRKHYRNVYQGIVVDKDTENGGIYSLYWCVFVKGYTHNNELRIDEWYLTQGNYEKYEIGSMFPRSKK